MKFAIILAAVSIFAVLAVAIVLFVIWPRRESPQPPTPFQLYWKQLVPATDGKQYQAKPRMLTDPNPPSEEMLRSIERELGVSLPDDYRQFLLEFNGAFIHVSPVGGQLEFVLKDSESDDEFNRGRLRSLFSLDERFGIVNEQLSYDFKKRVPKRIIAIGEWNGYFRTCISLEGEDRGTIYYWAPGEPWGNEFDPVGPTEKFLTRVAPDFRTFWNRLREPTPD